MKKIVSLFLILLFLFSSDLRSCIQVPLIPLELQNRSFLYEIERLTNGSYVPIPGEIRVDFYFNDFSMSIYDIDQRSESTIFYPINGSYSIQKIINKESYIYLDIFGISYIENSDLFYDDSIFTFNFYFLNQFYRNNYYRSGYSYSFDYTKPELPHLYISNIITTNSPDIPPNIKDYTNISDKDNNPYRFILKHEIYF